MITIVIEALSALQGGGQTYLRNLFQHYPGLPDTRVVAFVPHGLRRELAVDDRIEVHSPANRKHGIVQRLWWLKLELPKLLRKLGANLLYCPGGTLAVPGGGAYRTAVAFRNMLPFAERERKRYPAGYMRARLELLRLVQSASFRSADLVIFPSALSKNVIDATIPSRKGVSIVIPHGLSAHFKTPRPRPSDPRLPARYVLYVSILDRYKAQLEVVRAWSLLHKQGAPQEKLVLLGPEYPPYARRVHSLVRELRLDSEVVFLGAVPYAELPGYYQHATANIFASSCENCPNTLLEALAAGRPVLASKHPPMPEFGGDGALYFEPYEPTELVAALISVFNDADLAARLGAKARAQSLNFDWQQSAQRTWTALYELAR